MRRLQMADEDEGVGDSSANYLQNVQKSTIELMRIALQSRKNATVAGEGSNELSDVPALIEEKRRLIRLKISRSIELELRKQLSGEALGETSYSESQSVEELQKRVSELEREVGVQRARLAQDHLLLQRLQDSLFLTDHLFVKPNPSNEEKALQKMAEEQCEVTGDVGRVWGEVREVEGEVVRVQKERMESQTRCRELMAQLQEKRKESQTRDASTESDETARLTAALQQLTAEATLLRHSLQSLIVGSGVDWSGDQTLRDLTVSLGSTYHWELGT